MPNIPTPTIPTLTERISAANEMSRVDPCRASNDAIERLVAADRDNEYYEPSGTWPTPVTVSGGGVNWSVYPTPSQTADLKYGFYETVFLKVIGTVPSLPVNRAEAAVVARQCLEFADELYKARRKHREPTV